MASLATSLISDAVGVGLSELTQHSVRVKDATNENSAAQAAINAFDADVSQIASALKSGTISIQTAITFCEQENSAIESYLKSQVGKPGTAWSSSGANEISSGGSVIGTADCGKNCTAGCCIFFSYIQPGFQNTINALQQLQQSGGSVTHQYVAISHNKYGLQGRPSFSLTFQSSSASSASSLVGSLTSSLGLTSSQSPTISHGLIFAVIVFILLFFALSRK